jgi:hypothetical protein
VPGRRACRRRVEAYRGRNEQNTARERKQGPPDARQTSQHDCEPEECARHEADGRLHPEGGQEAGLGQRADRADERVITRGQPPADQDRGRGRRRLTPRPPTARAVTGAERKAEIVTPGCTLL